VRARRKKGAAQIGDGGQLPTEDHLAITRVHVLAPGWVGLAFFIDRNALAEPARHFVAGHLECHHVAELMPENGLPINRMSTLRGRAVGSDDAAEADSKIAW